MGILNSINILFSPNTNITKMTEQALKFKQSKSLEERLNEARLKKENNPNLIPVIIEKHPRSKLPELDKYKYLVSKDLKLHEFLLNIKQKLKLNKSESLFFFVANKKIDKPTALMGEIYEKSRDEDEFLYISFSELETFGGN